MNRRAALKLGTVPLVPWLSPPGPTTGKNRRWRTALALSGFASAARKQGTSFPLAEVLDFAARLGFDGVELDPASAARAAVAGAHGRGAEETAAREARRVCEAFGLRVFAFRLSADDAYAPDATRRLRWLEELAHRTALAQQMGASCLALAPAGGLRGQTVDEALFHLASSLRQTADLAAKSGLFAALDLGAPLSPFVAGKHLVRIVRGANHPGLKAICEPARLPGGASARGGGISVEPRERLGLRDVGYVRFAEPDAPALESLRTSGFHGWVAAEVRDPADPYGAVARAKRALDRAGRA